MEREPHDINEDFDFGKLVERRHQFKVIYESDPANPPEEFADVERDIDEEIGVPHILRKKTHTNPKYNINLAGALKKNYRKLARYRQYK